MVSLVLYFYNFIKTFFLQFHFSSLKMLLGPSGWYQRALGSVSGAMDSVNVFILFFYKFYICIIFFTMFGVGVGVVDSVSRAVDCVYVIYSMS